MLSKSLERKKELNKGKTETVDKRKNSRTKEQRGL